MAVFATIMLLCILCLHLWLTIFSISFCGVFLCVETFSAVLSHLIFHTFATASHCSPPTTPACVSSRAADLFCP